LKLAGLLGLFLGFLGWPAVTTGALLASLLGALGAACRPGLGGGSGRATIAFGPYLCLGTLLAVLLGP
jgi:leader peptidase (prepilin peptidase)/N-methyltransferase